MFINIVSGSIVQNTIQNQSREGCKAKYPANRYFTDKGRVKKQANKIIETENRQHRTQLGYDREFKQCFAE